MTDEDERELAWWRTLSTRFLPGELPPLFSSTYGRNLRVVEDPKGLAGLGVHSAQRATFGVGDEVICLVAGEAISGGGVVKEIIPGGAFDGSDAMILEGWKDIFRWPVAWFARAVPGVRAVSL